MRKKESRVRCRNNQANHALGNFENSSLFLDPESDPFAEEGFALREINWHPKMRSL